MGQQRSAWVSMGQHAPTHGAAEVSMGQHGSARTYAWGSKGQQGLAWVSTGQHGYQIPHTYAWPVCEQYPTWGFK